MDRNKKINLVSLLLGITALVMLVLGYMVGMPAPAITGIGFLLIIWAIQLLK